MLKGGPAGPSANCQTRYEACFKRSRLANVSRGAPQQPSTTRHLVIPRMVDPRVPTRFTAVASLEEGIRPAAYGARDLPASLLLQFGTLFQWPDERSGALGAGVSGTHAFAIASRPRHRRRTGTSQGTPTLADNRRGVPSAPKQPPNASRCHHRNPHQRPRFPHRRRCRATLGALATGPEGPHANI